MSTTMLKRDLGTGDLCNNIGLVGVSVSGAMSLRHLAIMILCFLCMLAIPTLKFEEFFYLLVNCVSMVVSLR